MKISGRTPIAYQHNSRALTVSVSALFSSFLISFCLFYLRSFHDFIKSSTRKDLEGFENIAESTGISGNPGTQSDHEVQDLLAVLVFNFVEASSDK